MENIRAAMGGALHGIHENKLSAAKNGGLAKKVKREAGALKVIGALETYAAHFDHPGWQPLKH